MSNGDYRRDCDEIEGEEKEYGWPLNILRLADNPILMHNGVRVWYVKNSVMDGGVAVLMRSYAVFLSESLIRRREVCKP